MFERYTEKARRVIFFSRYEASEVGSPYIESEHLLIGLMRESAPTLRRHMQGDASMEELRAEITASTLRRVPIPTSVDLPLSDECKRILAYAAEEAQRLAHEHIGVEHLVLAILREKDCLAARLLRGRGMHFETARASVAADALKGGAPSASGIGSGAVQQRNLRGFRVVEVETSDTLLISADSASIPRIGESLLIDREGNGAEQIPGAGCGLGIYCCQRRLAAAASGRHGRERLRDCRRAAIVRLRLPCGLGTPWAFPL